MDFETLIIIYLVILIIVVFYYVIPKIQRLEKNVYIEVQPSYAIDTPVSDFKKFQKDVRFKNRRTTKSKTKSK